MRIDIPMSLAARTMSALPCFSVVKLVAAQEEGNVLFPAGARGVVVDIYSNGTYGIEVSSPKEDVIVVTRENLVTA